jgi:choline dehydrogenase-like flavoprotein
MNSINRNEQNANSMTIEGDRSLPNGSLESKFSKFFILTRYVFPVILSVKNWGYFGAAECHKNTIKDSGGRSRRMGMMTNKRYDYIVVGTGPGGGTVAKELADGKRSVLIVEIGPHMTKTGFMKAARKAFMGKDKEALRSDGDIWIGRARILGGSSYVAMGNAATPPDKILNEWGLDLSIELEFTRNDLHVTPMPEEFMGKGTKRINDAADSLGWKMTPTSKCVDFAKCINCGLCMFGCPTGAKWTSLEFIDEALANGAELLLETEVKRVNQKNGKANGISGIQKGQTIEIEAENIILSAGALATPIILQNTGITEAGKGLANDIFQTTYGYTEDVGMQGEIVLATYLEQMIEERELFPAPYMYIPFFIQRDLDGKYPEKFSKLQEAQFFLRSKRIDANRIIGMMTKIRDERTGEVHNDGTITKKLSEKDQAKLDEAHEINKKILAAAGANAETIFRGVYESGHPCCTAAIGEIVNDDQETEIKGLFVSDASVFPSPLGMPPILTIVALSKRLADHLKTGE